MNAGEANQFQQAVQLQRQGDVDAAQAIYRELIAEDPERHAALHMLGVAYLQRSDFAQAADLIGRAIRLDSSKAVYFNNHGAALHGLGKHVEALACFHRAVAIRPEYVDAVSNLGMAYESLGQLELAAQHFRQALEMSPQHADARLKYAALVQRRGDHAEAARLCAEQLGEQPSAELHVRMGNLLLAGAKSQEAIHHYERALQLDPQLSSALFNLGNVYHEQHFISGARQAFVKAAGTKKGHRLWNLRAEATCPAVFQTTRDIDDFCGHLATTLRQWRAAPPPAKWQDLVHAGAFPNFTYSYLGRNVRGLKEEFAALYEGYFQNLPEPQGSNLAGKKRLGILVTQRHEGIFLRCLTGILQGLSRDLFELVILCGAPSVQQLREGLRIPGLRFVTFGNQLSEAAATIRQAACDVLYFWEAGSDALNYFLPFCRLAPIQCTSHGSQVTSGNPAIEHFYSSELMELESAQEHYSERLWKSSTLLMNQTRLPPPPPADRAKFGLPTDRTLYMALQNPLKFHPEFDPLLRDILRTDSRGVVVLLRGSSSYAEQDLRQRFARVMPDVADRVLFLPFQPFPEYCQLLRMTDVVIDPLYFGHGSSAYDVFSFNRPLVTLPTPLNVGRVGAACYTKMGLPDLIADSPAAYVSLATRLGQDNDYRLHTVRRISETSHLLFGDGVSVSDHQRFFAEISGLNAFQSPAAERHRGSVAAPLTH